MSYPQGKILRASLPDGWVALWHRNEDEPLGTVRGYRQVAEPDEEAAIQAMFDELMIHTYMAMAKEDVRPAEAKLLDHDALGRR